LAAVCDESGDWRLQAASLGEGMVAGGWRWAPAEYPGGDFL